jgi:hypothetical protein
VTRSTPRAANVRAAVWPTALLRYRWPEWPALPDHAKLARLRVNAPPPTTRTATHNATTDALHAHLAGHIDPETMVGDATPEVLALGSDGTGGDDGAFASADTSMDSPEGTVDVTDTIYDASGGDTTFTTFIDSSQLNGVTLAECGLRTGDGELWNHAPITPNIDKTNAKTAVVEVVLGFTN